MLSSKQLSLLHVAKRQLHLDDDTYRLILQRAAGVDSSKRLDNRGFDSALSELERLGFNNTAQHKGFGRNRPGMASDAEIALIRRLWGEFIGEPGSERGLQTWLSNHFGVSALRFLDEQAGRKVVGALKQMEKRKAADPPPNQA